MSAAKLEARLVITGEDKTGSAFGHVLKQVDRVGKALRQLEAVERAGRPLQAVGQQAASIDRVVRSIDRLKQSVSGLTAQESRLAGVVRHLKAIDALGGLYGAQRFAGAGIHAANDLGNAINQARMSGLSADELRRAMDISADLSRRYPSISQAEVLDMLRSQRSVTGSFEEATHVIDDNVRLRAIAQMKMPGQPVGEGLELLNKAMEMAGVTQDRDRHHRYMNYIAKMVQTYGASLKFEDISDMVKYSRGASSNLSERFFAGIMPSIASELGGSGAGTALATTYQALVGGQMKHAAIVALNDYGLLDQDKVIWNQVGSIKGVKPGGVKGSELFQTDPFEWVQTYLRPALQAKGVTDPKAESAVIASMFSNRMAQQFITVLLQQAKRLEKDAALTQGAEGLPAADLNRDRDSGTALQGLNTALQNFLGTVTGPLLEGAIPAINALSEALNRMAKVAQDNPLLGGTVGASLAVGAAGLGALGARAGVGILRSLFGAGTTAVTGAAEMVGAGGALASGGEAAGATAGGTGRALLGAALRLGGRVLGPVLILRELGEAANPMTPQGFPYRLDTADQGEFGAIYERSRRAQAALKQGTDMEAARGEAMRRVFGNPGAPAPSQDVKVDARVEGEARVTVDVTVKPSPELMADVDRRIETKLALRPQQVLVNSSGPGSTGKSMPDLNATGRFGRN